jgi:hypothetical protein
MLPLIGFLHDEKLKVPKNNNKSFVVAIFAIVAGWYLL